MASVYTSLKPSVLLLQTGIVLNRPVLRGEDGDKAAPPPMSAQVRVGVTLPASAVVGLGRELPRGHKWAWT